MAWLPDSRMRSSSTSGGGGIERVPARSAASPAPACSAAMLASATPCLWAKRRSTSSSMGVVSKAMTAETAPTATMFLARSEPPISLASLSMRTGRARGRKSAGSSTSLSS